MKNSIKSVIVNGQDVEKVNRVLKENNGYIISQHSEKYSFDQLVFIETDLSEKDFRQKLLDNGIEVVACSFV